MDDKDTRYYEAAKQVLAEECGIEGIDDRDQVRRILRAKMETMNAMDRVALTMHLGQAGNTGKGT